MYGKSSYFSSATDSIRSDLKISGTNDFSVSFWFYATTSVPRLFSIGRAETIEAGDGFFAISIDASINRIAFTVSTYTSPTVFEMGGTMNVPIVLSQWNHVVFTYDSTIREMRAYINNMFISSIKRTDFAWAIASGKGIMAVGADGSGNTVSKWQISLINISWGRIWDEHDIQGQYENNWKPQLKVTESFAPKINPVFSGSVSLPQASAVTVGGSSLADTFNALATNLNDATITDSILAGTVTADGATSVLLPATDVVSFAGTSLSSTLEQKADELNPTFTGTVTADGATSVLLPDTSNVSFGVSSLSNILADKADKNNPILTGNTSIESSLTVGGDTTLTGNVDISANLTVGGDFTVSGVTTYIDTETINIKDNIIKINTGVTTTPSFLVSGIEVDRGVDDNYFFVFEESSLLFKVGVSTDAEQTNNQLQAVATRLDSVNDRTIAVWDNPNNQYTYVPDVVVDTTGNVGIGTTTPQKKLDVIGDASISGLLSSTNLTVDSNITLTGTGTVSASNATSVLLPATSNVEYAGTSLSNLLAEKANTHSPIFTGTVDASAATAVALPEVSTVTLASRELRTATGLRWSHNTNRLGINVVEPQSDLDVGGNVSVQGNVGIGTVAPLEKLHVIGKVLATEGAQLDGTVLLPATNAVQYDSTSLSDILLEKADLLSPTFTGTVTLPEASNITVGTASLSETINTLATNLEGTTINNPIFTGTVTADTTGSVLLPSTDLVKYANETLSSLLAQKADLSNPTFVDGMSLPDATTVIVKVPPANDSTLVLSQDPTTSITTDSSSYKHEITKSDGVTQDTDVAAGGNYAQMGLFVNSYIESIENNIAGQSSYSIAFWIYLTTTVNKVFTIGKFGVASGTDALSINIDGTTRQWLVDSEPIGTAQALNVWNHIIFTYDSETGVISLYRNAALDGSITKTEADRVAWTIPSDSGMVRIGNTDGALTAVNGGYYDDTISATERSLVPVAEDFQTQASAADLKWNDVAWSPELEMYAAVAETPSAALTEWTTRSTSGFDNSWRGIAWAPELNLFAATSFGGSNNNVMTSSDGTTWIPQTTNNNAWHGIVWAPELSLFVAVASGSGNNVMISPNGTEWTISTTNGNAWRGIAWAPELGLFAAVATSGTNDRVMTSPDGITWTTRSTNNNRWIHIVWAPELSLFAAVAGGSVTDGVMTSPDGIVWTTRTTNGNAWRGIAWAPELGLFAAVGSNGSNNHAMTSPDGITWTPRITNGNTWYAITWAPEIGLFAAVGDSGTNNHIMTSPDGITWTTHITNNNNWWNIAWAPKLGRFAAVALTGTGNRVMTADLTETFENPRFTANIGPNNIASDYYSKYWWDTDQGWEASASSLSNNAWLALNKNDDDHWYNDTNDPFPHWHEIEYPEPVVITSYAVQSRNNTIAVRHLTEWVLQSFTGTDWVDLEPLRTESAGNWPANTTRTFSDNINLDEQAYNKYRLLINSASMVGTTIPGVALKWKLYTTFAGVMTSTNGSTWTAHAAPLGKKWEAITWAPPPSSKFVAVASGGTEGTRAMTSVDGYTWTAQVTPPKTLLRSVAWAPEISKFVAVGYSSDTRENPKFTINVSNEIIVDTNYSGAYGWDTGSGWVVRASSVLNSSTTFLPWKGFNKTAINSDDCWHSAETTPSVSNPQWLDIEYPYPVAIQLYNITTRNNSDFLWFPTQWRIQGSNDAGASWVNLESTRLESSWNASQTKLYTNGINTNKTAYKRYRLLIEGARRSNTDPDASYVAIANWSLFTNTSGLITSPDGEVWTTQVTPANKNWAAIAWAPPDMFAVVSYDGVTSGDRTITSADGITWIAHDEPYYNEWRSIAWSPQLNTFAAVASAVVKENPAFEIDNTTLTEDYSTKYGWDTNLGWVASARSSLDSNWQPWRGFNKTPDILWLSNATSPSVSNPEWIEIQYPYSVIIKSYSITSSKYDINKPWFPVQWKLQGYDSTVWVNLENTRNEKTWEHSQTKFYTDNINVSEIPYTRYRLLIEGSRASNTNSDGRFVAIGNWTLFTKEDSGGVMTTPKAISWTPQTSPVGKNWSAITWAPEANRFTAVAYNGTTSGNRAMTSSDGVTWTEVVTPSDNEWRGIAWSSELYQFAVVSSSGTGDRVMTKIPMPSNIYASVEGQFARTVNSVILGSQWSISMRVESAHIDGASLFTLSDKTVWAYSAGGLVRTRIAGVEHTFTTALPTEGIFQLTITYDRATNTRSLFIDGVAIESAVVPSTDETNYSATLDIFGVIDDTATPAVQSKFGQRIFYMYVLNRVITTAEMNEIDAFETHTNYPIVAPDGDWRIGQVNVAWGRSWTQYDIDGIYANTWLPELKISDAFITRANDVFNVNDGPLENIYAPLISPTFTGDVLASGATSVAFPATTLVTYDGTSLSSLLADKADLSNPTFVDGVILPESDTITVKVPRANDATLVISQDENLSIITDVSRYVRTITKTPDVTQVVDATYNNVALFSGVSSYIESDIAISGVKSLCIAFWINPATLPISKLVTIGTYNSLDTENGILKFWITVDGEIALIVDGTTITTSGVALIAGEWAHIIITLDESTGIVNVFKNSVSAYVLSNLTITTIPEGSGILRIGSTGPSDVMFINAGLYDAYSLLPTNTLVANAGGYLEVTTAGQSATTAYDVTFGEQWTIVMDINNVADSTYYTCGADFWAYSALEGLRVNIYGVIHTFDNGIVPLGRSQLTITYDSSTYLRSMYINGVLQSAIVLETTEVSRTGNLTIFGSITDGTTIASKVSQELHYMYVFNRVISTTEMNAYAAATEKLTNYPNITNTTTTGWRFGHLNIAWGRVWTQTDIDEIYSLTEWLPRLTIADTFVSRSDPGIIALNQPLDEIYAPIANPVFAGTVSLPEASLVTVGGASLEDTFNSLATNLDDATINNPTLTGIVTASNATSVLLPATSNVQYDGTSLSNLLLDKANIVDPEFSGSIGIRYGGIVVIDPSGNIASADRIPDLDAGKITTGAFAVELIPQLDNTKVPLLDSKANIADPIFTGNIGIGTAPSATLHVQGDILASGNITAFSDRRLKTDIKPIEDALIKIGSIAGVTYERTDMPSKRHAGLIAQDVEAVIPEVVHTLNDEQSTKTIAYGNFTALLVQAINELVSQNKTLTERVSELERYVFYQ